MTPLPPEFDSYRHLHPSTAWRRALILLIAASLLIVVVATAIAEETGASCPPATTWAHTFGIAVVMVPFAIVAWGLVKLNSRSDS